MLPDICQLCVVESVMNQKQRDEIQRRHRRDERERPHQMSESRRHKDRGLLLKRITELEAKLADVGRLPIKWLSESVGCGITPKDGDAKNFCAYELQEALNRSDEDVGS